MNVYTSDDTFLKLSVKNLWRNV